MSHALVLAGGRVVDPETGLDRVCDVGIDGDSITAVGDDLDCATTVDVGSGGSSPPHPARTDARVNTVAQPAKRVSLLLCRMFTT